MLQKNRRARLSLFTMRFSPFNMFRLGTAVFAIAVASVVSVAQDATPTPSPTPVINAGATPAPRFTPSPILDPVSTDPMPTQPVFSLPPRQMPAATRVGVVTGTDLSLSLERAIEMALDNNTSISVSRIETRISDFNLRAARGVYDPLINSEAYYESRTTPTASTIGGAVDGKVTQRQFFGNAGVSGFVPRFGGSYDVIFNSSRVDTTNRNATLNPQYPTSFVATYVQPLLRGRRIDNFRRSILIAGKNVEISDILLKQQAIVVVSDVERAYWDLYFSLRNFQVQSETLRQAREQLESNQRQVDRGVLAPVEIVAAQAQIATFEQAVLLAQENITRAENQLKTLILPDRKAAAWSQALIPITPIRDNAPQTPLAVAVAEALKNRPEIEQLEKTSDINRIDQDFYRDQTKPQIDLVGSYTSQGLAGSPNPLSSGSGNVPPNLIGGYFSSLGNLVAQDFPVYRAGVQISLPWGNRVAKANLGRSIVEGDRIEVLRTQAEQAIEAEVRNALQAIRSAEARVAAATAARVAAEELYNSEQRQFRSGTTTFYLVLQRQTDLSAARGREIQAQTDLAIAITVYNRAVGATLSSNNVVVTR